jgi:sarcosine oxidase subunit gamma
MLEVLGAGTFMRVQTWDTGASVPEFLEDALNVEWPKLTGAIAHGRVDVICVGPAEWLVLKSDPDASVLLQKLSASFAASPFRFVDVSSSLSRIELEGPHARTLLSKSCALDVHPDVFRPGRSARTRFAGMPVIVWCQTPSQFQLIVTSSYSEYLVDWLTDTSLEFDSVTAAPLELAPGYSPEPDILF